MAGANANLLELSDQQRRELERDLVEFDCSWSEERLAAQVRSPPCAKSPWRLAALVEMVKIDLERQWERGQQPSIEAYLETYPELGTVDTVPADLIQAEYEVRRQFGAMAELADFAGRFPRQADQLRRLIEQSRQVLDEGELDGANQDARTKHGHVPTSVEIGAPPAVELPEQFGRYRILRELGHGGMGSVYLAYDPQLDRRVALKVPRFSPEDDPEIQQRFYREARAAADLQHPNLCPLYDVGEIGGIRYLTMAYLEGSPLANLLRPGEPLPEEQAAGVISKLARALQEAHARGVVHRDLKPSNIIIDRNGEPVIVDFGLAWRSGGRDPRLTQSGDFLGTPAYVAPEQVRGDLEAPGPGCDIYSLGVILYEMLAGRLPFHGSAAVVLGEVQHVEPPRPSQFRPGLDPALEAICLKAMAKRPEHRHASMAELAAALEQYLEGTFQVTVLRPRRTLRLLLAAAGAAALVLAGVIITVAITSKKVKVEISRTEDAGVAAGAAEGRSHAAKPPPSPPGLPTGVYRESPCADMPLAIHGFACSDVFNGRFYTFGGDRGNDLMVDTILVYDTAKDLWREVAGKMPYAYVGRSNGTALCGGKIYITPDLGPRRNNGWGQHHRIIEFDPATETAVEKASFGAIIWGLSPVTYRNVIWWFGAAGLGQEKKIWRYDPATDSLAHVCNLAGRGRIVSAILGTDGCIWMFGGHRGETTIEVYDPDSNTCAIAAASLPQPMGAPHVWPGPGDLIYLTRPIDDPQLWSFEVPSGNLRIVSDGFSFSRTCNLPGHAYDPDTGKVYFCGGHFKSVGERPLNRTYVLVPNRPKSAPADKQNADAR